MIDMIPPWPYVFLRFHLSVIVLESRKFSFFSFLYFSVTLIPTIYKGLSVQDVPIFCRFLMPCLSCMYTVLIKLLLSSSGILRMKLSAMPTGFFNLKLLRLISSL